MTPRVLFVGHGAERTGPPIGLLHLLRWLREHVDLRIEVLLLADGPLTDAYRDVGPVTILDEWNPPSVFAALETGAGLLGRPTAADRVRRAAMRHLLRNLARPDLIYVNTAWTLRALRFLPPDVPVVAAVHELEVGLDYHLPESVHDVLVRRPRRVVAVADAVAENLIVRHGIEPNRVTVHHEMIETTPVDEPVRLDRRRRLAADERTVVIGSAGLTHWRKAPDLFVRLSMDVIGRLPDREVRFLWVGGDLQAAEAAAFRADVGRAGLGDRLRFVPHVTDPAPWLAAMDVFVLPAREDAFPLVCLEAAAQGVPVVCFDNGGMPEFVVTGSGPCGAVVAYPDLTAMAGAVEDLVVDVDRRRALGAVAAERARLHHDVATVAPALWETVAGVLT